MRPLEFVVMLPFTREQFFDVFAAYNRSLWPVALGLWAYAVAAAVLLVTRDRRHTRFAIVMLAFQWAWAGVAYHATFFGAINPAAWLFAVLFVVESVLLVWFGVVHERVQFAPAGSPRHVVGWALIVYALIYPALAYADGHAFPRGPTFGLPCPTTLLTIGWLFTAEPPWPNALAFVPLAWALVGGSAAVLFGVRADLMLWIAGFALAVSLLNPTPRRVRV